MSALRLTDGDRLAVLAAAVLEVLDEELDGNEPDESDPRAWLYNLADAMRDAAEPVVTVGVPGIEQERNRARGADAREHADRLATEVLSHGSPAWRLERLRARLLTELGA